MKKKLFIVPIFTLFCFGLYFALNHKNSSPSSVLSADATREIASASGAFDASTQQSVVDTLNAKILAIAKRESVKTVAKEIQEIAAKPEMASYPAVQMYGAVAAILPQFEGIIFRCRAFVESSDWLHMSTLFKFRDFKYNNYLYGAHVDAIFDYLTYPSAAAGQPFQTVSELQNYLLQTVAPGLEAILARTYQLEKLPSENFEFNFDRTVLVGHGSGLRLLDPDEAVKKFIKPYHYTITFLLERTLGSLYYISALQLDELPLVVNRIIKKTTLNNFRGDFREGTLALGVTPEMVYEVMRAAGNFLGWRNKLPQASLDTVDKLLNRSFDLFKSSSKYQYTAFVCGLVYPYQKSQGSVLQINDKLKDCDLASVGDTSSFHINNGSKYLFDPNSMVLGLKQKYNMFRQRADLYENAAQGKYATVTSDVTGVALNINVKALFNSQISQRSFFPRPDGYKDVPASTDLDNSNVLGRLEKLIGAKKANYAWNYDHGKPLRFDDYTFGGFFDKSQVFDTDSLYKAMTTVLYTDSVSPFALFIRVPSTARLFNPPTENNNQ